MLAGVMALAISSLLIQLRRDNAQDYVLGAFFLICTTAFLKIRWFVGASIQVPRSSHQKTHCQRDACPLLSCVKFRTSSHRHACNGFARAHH